MCVIRFVHSRVVVPCLLVHEISYCRSTPLSIPDHIDLTPDTFAAALSEVQLALEIMDPHSTGVAAPQSWHGRYVSCSD
jgi:hypothetical protein